MSRVSQTHEMREQRALLLHGERSSLIPCFGASRRVLHIAQSGDSHDRAEWVLVAGEESSAGAIASHDDAGVESHGKRPIQITALWNRG